MPTDNQPRRRKRRSDLSRKTRSAQKIQKKRNSESAEKRAARLAKYRERVALKRAQETPEEREERLQAGRRRVRRDRMRKESESRRQAMEAALRRIGLTSKLTSIQCSKLDEKINKNKPQQKRSRKKASNLNKLQEDQDPLATSLDMNLVNAMAEEIGENDDANLRRWVKNKAEELVSINYLVEVEMKKDTSAE